MTATAGALVGRLLEIHYAVQRLHIERGVHSGQWRAWPLARGLPELST